MSALLLFFLLVLVYAAIVAVVFGAIASRVVFWIDRCTAKKIRKIVREYESREGEPYPWADTFEEMREMGIDTGNLEHLRNLSETMPEPK